MKKNITGIGDLLPPKLREEIRRACEIWDKMPKEGDPIPAVPQTPEQIADMTWHCPTCKRSLGLLQSLGKTRMMQGYLQCVDCGSDIDCASLKPRRFTKQGFGKLIKELHPDSCPSSQV